jgi:hypothetical protein
VSSKVLSESRATTAPRPELDLPAPVATRLARPRWLDVRLVTGVLLVLGSVVVGARVVAAADDTYDVWAVRGDLGALTTLTADDLEPVPVRLDDHAARYLGTATSPAGRVLTRPVEAGELLPASALVDAASADLRRVVLEVERVSTAGLQRGRVVDVYAVPAAAPGQDAEPPELVIEAVTVDEVSTSGGGLASGGATLGVTLLVDAEHVPDLLAAEEGGRVVLVQVPDSFERAAAVDRARTP